MHALLRENTFVKFCKNYSENGKKFPALCAEQMGNLQNNQVEGIITIYKYLIVKLLRKQYANDCSFLSESIFVRQKKQLYHVYRRHSFLWNHAPKKQKCISGKSSLRLHKARSRKQSCICDEKSKRISLESLRLCKKKKKGFMTKKA